MVQPMVENHICELESFSDVFLPASSDVPFSAVDNSTAVRVGLPPRIVGRALSEQMMAHEFVGYVPNPAWRRGSPYGSATRAVAGLRNMRQTRKVWWSGQFKWQKCLSFFICWVLNFLKPHSIQEVVPSKNAFIVMSTHVTLHWKDGWLLLPRACHNLSDVTLGNSHTKFCVHLFCVCAKLDFFELNFWIIWNYVL